MTIVLSLFALIFLCSCSNNPSSVAEKVFETLSTKNYPELVSLMGDDEGEAFSEDQQLLIIRRIESSPYQIDTNNLRIINEERDDNTASMEILTVYRGRPFQMTLQFVKGSDSQWRLVYTEDPFSTLNYSK